MSGVYRPPLHLLSPVRPSALTFCLVRQVIYPPSEGQEHLRPGHRNHTHNLTRVRTAAALARAWTKTPRAVPARGKAVSVLRSTRSIRPDGVPPLLRLCHGICAASDAGTATPCESDRADVATPQWSRPLPQTPSGGSGWTAAWSAPDAPCPRWRAPSAPGRHSWPDGLRSGIAPRLRPPARS